MYIYIHGFNSDTCCRSYKDLCKILDTVRAIGYTSSEKAMDCYNNVCRQIEQYIQTEEDIKLLGSSLGGFFALHMAKKYALPVVAFNPVTFPHTQLRPYLGKSMNFYTLQEWDFTEEILFSYEEIPLQKHLPLRPTLIIGQKDEVLDYSIAQKFWDDEAKIILTNDAHSIVDYSLYLGSILER